MTTGSIIHRVLESARWAPSADNVQPWRFEVVSETSAIIHGQDSRSHCVYDLDGRITQIAIGALLETVRISAASLGYRARIESVRGLPEDRPTHSIELDRDPDQREDPLFEWVPLRTVQRRPLALRRLDAETRQALQAALPNGWSLILIEDLGKRLEMARLLYLNGKLRLTLPEAYPVHRDTIRWNGRFSEDGIPAPAVGLDPATTLLMRWALGSWGRVRFLNRYLAGHVLPCLELDFLPAIACSAQFALVAPRNLMSSDDYVEAGGVVQRFWLTTAKLKLQFQPTVSPLVFARYQREGRPYTSNPDCRAMGAAMAGRLQRAIGADILPRVAFMGRVGYGRDPKSRSIRLSLDRLRWHRGSSPGN